MNMMEDMDHVDSVNIDQINNAAKHGDFVHMYNVDLEWAEAMEGSCI